MDWLAVNRQLADLPRTYQRTVATFAIGNVTFATATGVGPPPSPVNVLIPAGTIVATAGGIQFATIGTLTLPAGASFITLPVQAILVGASGNMDANTITTIVSPLSAALVCYNIIPTLGGSDSTYTWLANALTAGLTRYTAAADGLIAQLVFQDASGTWLDTWGQVYGYRRNNNESDDAYQGRIQFLLGRPPASDIYPGASAPAQGGKGTPIAIENYIYFIEGVDAQVIENFPAIGYQVQVGGQTFLTYLQIANDLKYVRPAGVPFLPFLILTGGLYLDTINYLNAPKVTGAYLLNPTSKLFLSIGASTNNTVPLLPTTFLTDPTINPSLA